MTALRAQEVSGATDDMSVVRERGDIMANDDRVRGGLVGLGRMGRFHAANLAGPVPGARLMRKADAAEGEAHETSGRLGGVRWSTRYEDLLEDPEGEAVVVASPTPTHAEMAAAAAAAGKRIFCEKPVSLELEPTYHLIEAVRTPGVRMQVGFQRRLSR
jgi:scyllo-inositol 2-dehydrogenase (NAD+)